MSKSDLRMIIFDFDGVIADSEKAHFEMFGQSLLDEGIELTWPEYCEKYLGYSDLECIKQVLADKGRQYDNETVERFFQRKKALFAHFIEQNSLIIPGVRRLLEELCSESIICSICSGALTEEIEFILNKERLRDFFAFIVSADDVSQSKPDPEGYRLCLDRINVVDEDCSLANNADYPAKSDADTGRMRVLAGQCVVIEDSIWGIQAAHAADMRCLAVGTSYPAEKLREAEMVVNNLTEVNAALLRKVIL
ncbi:MAG: HAD family phosphatase [Sedimentisphaerales bacterium]|nr:HAD family phosphatase [Sedimentisphaerales bacterium]